MTDDGRIPLCVPEIRGNEWKYLKECLDTNWVSSVGPFVDRFERMTAEYVGARCAVAAVNGTSALHIALLLAGIEPGDEVVMPSMTFIAPANAVRYAGGWPVFVDSEPDYWQIDSLKLADFLENGCQYSKGELHNRATGRRVKAVLPVHILGHTCDMDPVLEAARRYGLAVIEDAAECIGARYKGRMAGRLGDIACFSFNGNKVITAGGGGMIVTDNEAWGNRARYLTTQAKDDPVEFVHHEIGYNYRLTNIQAALGCAQMERLDEYIAAKRRIADTYTQALKDVPGLTPMREAEWAFSTCWMYTVLVDAKLYGQGSRDLLRQLEQVGIQSRPLWQPLHLSRAFQGAFAADCSVAERLYQTALSLPCSVGLTPSQQSKVCRISQKR